MRLQPRQPMIRNRSHVNGSRASIRSQMPSTVPRKFASRCGQLRLLVEASSPDETLPVLRACGRELKPGKQLTVHFAQSTTPKTRFRGQLTGETDARCGAGN